MRKAREQYIKRLESCGASESSSQSSENLLFLIDGDEVCEKFFATMIGVVTATGFKSKVWLNERAKLFGNVEPVIEKDEMDLNRRAKRDHAYAYIKRVVDSEINDRSAFKGQENSICLPYRRLHFFYGEYDFYCEFNKLKERGRESTFKRAFNELKKTYEKEGRKVKFNSGKGK